MNSISAFRKLPIHIFLQCVYQTALRKIATDINNIHVEQEIVALWLEYENCVTPEAVLAFQLDKLEMIIQANEYEEQQNVVLEDFFQSTKDCFTHPEVRFSSCFLHDATLTCGQCGVRVDGVYPVHIHMYHPLLHTFLHQNVSVQIMSWNEELRTKRAIRLTSSTAPPATTSAEEDIS